MLDRVVDHEIEVSSGKGRGSENFPVASRLIAPRYREPIIAYYAFARAIDDIADSPRLDSAEKLARLRRFADGLHGEADAPQKAVALRSVLLGRGITLSHGLDLIEAFRRDAVQGRYRDWADLMGYCALSAAPVGRFLLDLHGEDAQSTWPASDALCAALQVLNHLQDCQEDYRVLDRVYLAQVWLAEEGVVDGDLDNASATAGLRRVLDRHVGATRELIAEARGLPSLLRDARLRAEAAAIVAIAEKLADRLGRQDPLLRRVRLSRLEYFRCIGGGLRTFLS